MVKTVSKKEKVVKEPDVFYQYAVKVIQGGIKLDDKPPYIGPGVYFTSVNVHNPWGHTVKYAVKLAVSGPNGEPGDISSFQFCKLPPDGATEYDSLEYLSLLGSMPAFLEGYFVIQSEEELDVVGVYTGAAIQDKRLGAMHMERVPARLLPRCKDLKMNISTGMAEWQLTAVPSGSTLQTGPAPVSVPPCSAWTEPSSPIAWVGTSGLNHTARGKYTYELSFCLCWTFYNAKMNLTVWGDNLAKVFLNNTQIGATPTSGSWNGPGTEINNVTTGFQSGMNTLKVEVTNNELMSGMMLKGTLAARAADCNS